MELRSEEESCASNGGTRCGGAAGENRNKIFLNQTIFFTVEEDRKTGTQELNKLEIFKF
jgi:hypothetical protein